MCVSLECIRITYQSHCQFDQTWHDMAIIVLCLSGKSRLTSVAAWSARMGMQIREGEGHAMRMCR